MRTILLLLLYGIFAILLIPVILVCYLAGWREPIVATGKYLISVGRRILGIRIEVSGVDRIDRKKAYVFMANHLSFLDGPLLFWLIPQSISVVLKKETFRIPIIGQGMSVVGFVPVDRKRMRGGKRSIDKAARLIKENGLSFLIFPEGTRSRSGELGEARAGVGMISVATGRPVIPVYVEGTGRLLGALLGLGGVRVRFGTPMFPDGIRGDRRDRYRHLSDQVMKEIAKLKT